MAIAGYQVRFRKSGDSTAMSAEATTSLGGNSYQITTAARRCVNPDAAFSVLDSGVTLDYSGVASVNWAFGIFTLGSAPGGAVTVNGEYFPLTTSSEDVAEGVGFTVSMNTDLLDTTVWGQDVRSRVAALKDVEVSLNVISSRSAYSSAYAAFANGTRLCMEFDPDRSTSANEVFRIFGKLDSVELTGAVEGRVESTITFKVDASKNSNGFIPGYHWA